MKKIFTLMLLAVVAMVFVSCNTPEDRMKKIIRLMTEQDALRSEARELEADAYCDAIDRSVNVLKNFEEDFGYLYDAAEQKVYEEEICDLEIEINKREAELEILSGKVDARYFELNY